MENKTNENNCIFCKIINGDIPCLKIAENNGAIAFLDVSPISDGHVLVITKSHYIDFSRCDKNTMHYVVDLMIDISQAINNSELDNWGINYISNEGKIAGQEVYHVHFHIIPKFSKNEGLAITANKYCLYELEKVSEIIKKNLCIMKK